MPASIIDASHDLVDQSAVKATQSRDVPRYFWSSMLAGAYVGIAVVLLASVAGPLIANSSPLAKLTQGAVFGIALTLVVFAGAELFTGNAMVMLQGVLAGRVRPADLARVWAASLLGNLVGSLAFAALVHGGGSLTGTPAANLVAGATQTKNLATGPQLFWRAILCNMLVCLALWMAARAKGDAAKLVVLWWALLAFIASGFEHSVANMTLYALGVFQGSAQWSDLARNLAWTVPGNVVGGGLLVGLGYGWLARQRPRATAPVVEAEPLDVRPAAAVPA